MDQSAHTNCAGVETIPLYIITEGPKSFTVEGSQPFELSGASLYDTMSDPIVIHSNQETTKLYRLVHGYQNISFGILYSCTEVWRWVFGQSSNDVIGMNPPRTIRGIIPQITKHWSFNIFDSIAGMSDIFNRREVWHGEVIIEIAGGNSILKNAGRQNNFEVDNFGHKNPKNWITIIWITLAPTWFTPMIIMLTQIKPILFSPNF